MIKESYLMKGTFEIKSLVFFRYCIIEYRYSMIREKKELHCYFWMGLSNVNSQLIKTNQKPKKLVWAQREKVVMCLKGSFRKLAALILGK